MIKRVTFDVIVKDQSLCETICEICLFISHEEFFQSNNPFILPKDGKDRDRRKVDDDGAVKSKDLISTCFQYNDVVRA